MSIMHGLILRAYSFAWKTAQPFLRRNRRLADGFADRQAPAGWVDPPFRQCGPPGYDVWIQAASGGEARLACTLIEAMGRHSSPPRSVLAVTWTRQGKDILEAGVRNAPFRVDVRFAPFDDPQVAERALQQANPSLVILLETELWPGLLHACWQKGLPVAILNGRLTLRTTRQYLALRGLFRPLAPKLIAAISSADAERFSALFPDTPVEVVPNIKFDQTAALISGAAPAPAGHEGLRAHLTGGTLALVLLASTREEEEDILIRALNEMWGREDAIPGPASRLVVAPRHMHRLDAWKEKLGARGIRWILRSEMENDARPLEQDTVVLWDTFGELPMLYSMADVVFVGGSLAPLGGQNFLESLAAGVVPWVGPSTENFVWALETGQNLEQEGLLRRAGNAHELVTGLDAEARRGPLPTGMREETRARFGAWLARHQGGTDRQAELALRLLAHQKQ